MAHSRCNLKHIMFLNLLELSCLVLFSMLVNINKQTPCLSWVNFIQECSYVSCQRYEDILGFVPKCHYNFCFSLYSSAI